MFNQVLFIDTNLFMSIEGQYVYLVCVCLCVCMKGLDVLCELQMQQYPLDMC